MTSLSFTNCVPMWLLRFMVQVFGANWLLVLVKFFCDIHPIAMGVGFYTCTFVMCLLLICYHISSGWWLKEVVKLQSILIEPIWMPILIAWCSKYTLQTLSTPSCIRSFSKSFKQRGVNCSIFFLLFVVLLAFGFFPTLIIILSQGLCLSFFLLWALIKAIHL